MQSILEIYQKLEQNLLFSGILKSIIVFLLIFFTAFLISRYINHSIEDLKRRHHLRKMVYYISIIFLIILITSIWVEELRHLATFLSVVGAGIALALHQVILSVAGWIYIIIKRPYAIGDRIEVAGVRGDVIDIGMFHTIILEIGNWVAADQSTGRVVHLQNNLVFREALCNYTHGFEYIWNEIPITVTFESDWEAAAQIILNSAEEGVEDIEREVHAKMERMTSRYVIRYNKLRPIVYVSIADSGVLLTLRYLCDARRRRGSTDQICRKVLTGFTASDHIAFAYPTIRYFDHLQEGKSGLVPKDLS